jgi:hypothetical protein
VTEAHETMINKQKIYFVHEGRAMYPLIRSMRECYADEFEMEECSFSEAEAKPDLDSSVCWHMMGFYPKRLDARLTIHDYRSLSLGKGMWIKDRVKELFCAKPDVRVIQPSIEKYLHFSDRVQTYLLDVAISDFVLDYSYHDSGHFEYDFCYIGSMTAERKMELVLDSFLSRFGGKKTFVLVGRADQYLIDRYDKVGGIRFLGAVPQRKAYEIVAVSKVAVAYFPDHAPHKFQTPTKLLEYAAIGSRILANRQIMNIEKADQYSIECAWRTSDDIFENIDPDDHSWTPNTHIDRAPLLFRTHMENSCILEKLQNARQPV